MFHDKLAIPHKLAHVGIHRMKLDEEDVEDEDAVEEAIEQLVTVNCVGSGGGCQSRVVASRALWA